MSYWHVTNHKLYSGTSTSDVSHPIFIVGTEFPFSKTNNNVNGYLYVGDWTGTTQKYNRAAAGNSVYMWGNYFGTYNPSVGAGYLLSCFSQQNNNVDLLLKYFIPNIDHYDYTGGGGDYPRGQHSYVQNQTTYVDKGHWKKLPLSSFLNNDPGSDLTYITSWSNYASYWDQNNNYNGTELWHSAWLSNVKNLSINNTNFSNNIAAWFLMDEPDRSDKHRDYVSAQFSVSGHSSFCYTADGDNLRPKMVGTGPSSNANNEWTKISGAVNIIAGNCYGQGNDLWYTPNMVAWMYSKISSDLTKMVIPWLWGSYTDINHSKYVFYGSLIEGARGVLWWLNDGSDYSNYTHQINIFSNFSNNASFNSIARPSDLGIFLSGTELSLINYSTNHTFSSPNYPATLTKEISIKAFSYLSNGNTRWRIYAANHMTVNSTLTADISGTPATETAYKRDSTSFVVLANQGATTFRIIDTIAATSCQIYDEGI